MVIVACALTSKLACSALPLSQRRSTVADVPSKHLNDKHHPILSHPQRQTPTPSSYIHPAIPSIMQKYWKYAKLRDSMFSTISLAAAFVCGSLLMIDWLHSSAESRATHHKLPRFQHLNRLNTSTRSTPQPPHHPTTSTSTSKRDTLTAHRTG